MHAQAWQDLFDEVLPELSEGVAAFDPVEDYRRYVDGRSREDGVRAVLSARGLALPQRAPDDPPRRPTVHGLAARKQELFAARLAGGGVRAFPSTVTLLRPGPAPVTGHEEEPRHPVAQRPHRAGARRPGTGRPAPGTRR